jgi:hypothetical protein
MIEMHEPLSVCARKLKIKNCRLKDTELRFRCQVSGFKGQEVDLRLENLKIKRFKDYFSTDLSTYQPNHLTTYQPKLSTINYQLSTLFNQLTNHQLTKIKEVKNGKG